MTEGHHLPPHGIGWGCSPHPTSWYPDQFPVDSPRHVTGDDYARRRSTRGTQGSIFIRRPDLAGDIPEEFDTADRDEILGSWKWWKTDLELCSDAWDSGGLPGVGFIPIEKTRTDKELIETFLSSHSLGIFPPVWVMNRLNEIFDKFNKKACIGDYNNIGDYFKITKVEYERHHRIVLYDNLCTRVERLNYYYGIDYNDCCNIVIQAVSCDNKTSFNIGINKGYGFKNNKCNIGLSGLIKKHRIWIITYRDFLHESFERS